MAGQGDTDMSSTKHREKKRSVPGTILYCLAVLVKIVGIGIAYLIISDNAWFLGFFRMVADFEEQGIGMLYFGSILMALQIGILLYSLTHDGYMLGRKDRWPWMKALVFLWSPVQALFVWFRERGYAVMSWEYGAMVIVDILIFVGCVCKTGTSWANRLRPFKDKKPKADVESTAEYRDSEDSEVEDEHHRAEPDSARHKGHGWPWGNKKHGSEDHNQDLSPYRQQQQHHLCTCPLYRNQPPEPTQQTRQEPSPYSATFSTSKPPPPSSQPKIRVDGATEEVY